MFVAGRNLGNGELSSQEGVVLMCLAEALLRIPDPETAEDYSKVAHRFNGVALKQGDTVHVHLTNVEQAKDATHGFAIGAHNVNVSIEPGEHSNMTFVASRPGVYPLYCTEFCSALHLEMAGYLLVEPN